jgi:ABC-type maltose transport system permease subunit
MAARVRRIGSIDAAAQPATAVVASIPATVLLLVAQRYIAAGVTAGAVKE